MSNVLIEKNKLDVLATAISNKSGEPLKLTLDEMVEAVDGIETGGGGITPTGNINITHAGQTDVTDYATATVPLSIFHVDKEYGFYTENNLKKWRVRSKVSLDPEDGDVEGWIESGIYYDNYSTFYAIPKNTTITPTESSQTIGGARYMMEGAVTVGAISSTYVGSGIDRRDSTDLTASGATVTVQSGYYSAQASKAVDAGSATAPSTISGTSASISTGTNTLTLSKTVSVTPVVSAGYVASGTAGNSAVSLTASVTTKGAATITPGTSNQEIASGTYLTGKQTISGDANLVGSNIKSGVSIFGVAGSLTSATISQDSTTKVLTIS